MAWWVPMPTMAETRPVAGDQPAPNRLPWPLRGLVVTESAAPARLSRSRASSRRRRRSHCIGPQPKRCWKARCSARREEPERASSCLRLSGSTTRLLAQSSSRSKPALEGGRAGLGFLGTELRAEHQYQLAADQVIEPQRRRQAAHRAQQTVDQMQALQQAARQ